MRIVGGAWRGRTLVAPPGQGTRPTADRVRQALFDMLMHAEWGGRAVIEDAVVLDVFAGTGALGLEALSRGAASACFIENDPAALKALRANVAACGAEQRSVVLSIDVLRLSARAPRHAATNASFPSGNTNGPASLVFLDPPYQQNLVPQALGRLREAALIAPNAFVVAETGRAETWLPDRPLLAERLHGAARMLIYRQRPLETSADICHIQNDT